MFKMGSVSFSLLFDLGHLTVDLWHRVVAKINEITRERTWDIVSTCEPLKILFLGENHF